MIRLQAMPDASSYSIARFYTDVDAGPRAPFQAVCVIEWTPIASEVWVHGMLATEKISRVHLRELIETLAEREVRHVFAWRDTARRLPGGVMQPDGSTKIALAAFMPMVGVPSDWVAL